MIVNETIKIDLKIDGMNRIDFNQYDVNSHVLTLDLRENDETWLIPNGLRVFLSGTTPISIVTGKFITVWEEFSIVNGKASITIPEYLLEINGVSNYQICIISETDTQWLNTSPFRIHIIKSPLQDEAMAELMSVPQYKVFQQAVSRVDNAFTWNLFTTTIYSPTNGVYEVQLPHNSISYLAIEIQTPNILLTGQYVDTSGNKKIRVLPIDGSNISGVSISLQYLNV